MNAFVFGQFAVRLFTAFRGSKSVSADQHIYYEEIRQHS
jgi:hypothetical protein